MKFDYLQERLDRLRADFRFRDLTPRTMRGTTLIDRDGHQLVNFGSNDYLGIAAQQQTTVQPTGSTASALVCGWTTLHQQLAEEITSLEGTESATLFPSGFAACCGTIAALAEKGDLILSDQLNHASLIDGCRLSYAERIVYPHRSVSEVDAVLSARRSEFNRVWIVTDSVFSMDGHVAPLSELCDLAEKHDAILVVDEAHATGVLGENGSGLSEALGIKQRISSLAIRIGTLSKAIGAQGGFVAGDRAVIEYLVNRCRSLIYSTSLAPASAQAALDAMEVIREEPQRREHVRSMSRLVREKLFGGGDGVESEVPIIPVGIGDEQRTLQAAKQLYEQGFFVPAIRPPTVPNGTSRLRISLSAAHSREMVESLISAVSDLQ